MPPDALETYKQVGVAGVFILLYVTTVWFLIKYLVKSKKEAVAQTRELADVVKDCTKAVEDNKEALDKLRILIDNFITKQLEALAYERGREDGRKRN